MIIRSWRCLGLLFLMLPAGTAFAQTATKTNAVASTAPKVINAPGNPGEIDEIKRQLAEQQKQIDQLLQIMAQQAKMIASLTNGIAAKPSAPIAENTPVPTETLEERLIKVEQQAKKTSAAVTQNQLGTLGFSGDLRMQYDSLSGLLANGANVNNSAILGNELSPRHRLRYRLRFAVRGKIGGDVFSGFYTPGGERRLEKEFEWGIRLTVGSIANPASPNSILTDFFSRKPIDLDQVYVSWRPRSLPGLKIIAGKFEPTWSRTEMTLDNDIQVEGLSEVFSREFKNSPLKQITLSAWQLPMLERGTTFIRNADGTVNLGESRRNGRDLGLYGAQLQGKFALGSKTTLSLAITDQNFLNTDAINPVQVFGTNIQLPVSVTLPATSTTPSQTVIGVVSIPREFLVAGNGNLGLSAGTNNAIGRNGRLASGFNLIDLTAQLDLKQLKYNPMSLLIDYVRNTRTRNVIVAGNMGQDVVLKNNENQGIWAEFRVQNLRRKRGSDFAAAVRGDMMFSYTYLRIEKDAVLTPFNWDDLIQGSDILAHRLFLSYTVDPRVSFNVTGLFSKRPNGLNGPFGTTPPGSLNRFTNRFQFDTIFKF